jgi:acetyl-CoA C-acetyltransferase
MRGVVILAGVRTPLGAFGGMLRDTPAIELGGHALQEALSRAGVDPAQVGEVVLGQVFQAGCGANPARQAALAAGIPPTVPAWTVNHLCASGLKAVALAAQSIRSGDLDLAVAGGMESMSGVPYLLPSARWGTRMGEAAIRDGLLQDGLVCPFTQVPMGSLAEDLARELGIAREDQDAYALESHRRAAAAWSAGAFSREVLPLRGRAAMDEGVRPTSSGEALAALPPAFREGGTVTAGNASPLSDGAAALVLAREGVGGAPRARILAFAQAALAPRDFGLAPLPAIHLALQRAGLRIQDLDLVELNEAFAAQVLALLRAMPDLDPARLNVRGGALALGHPVGASGARILVTLLHALEDAGLRYGLAALCVGGGQGVAMIIERLDRPGEAP